MNETDPLAGLREQVRAATEAAERLVREAGGATLDQPPGGSPAAGAAAQSPPLGADARETVPPAGWQQQGQDQTAAELQALAGVLHSLRELLPAELQEQLTEVVRQILILLRALIDWAVSRIERERPGRSPEVEDIPLS